VGSSLEESIQEFRQFLDKFDYPQKVVWITPRDVLFTDSLFIYIKVPVPTNNEKQVRQLFDLSQATRRGILFGTICAIEDTTYAYAWVPGDAGEEERRMMNSGLKMSVPAGDFKRHGEIVRSLLRWSYLQLKLRNRQNQKNFLFS
jgi:hypothetical protein